MRATMVVATERTPRDAKLGHCPMIIMSYDIRKQWHLQAHFASRGAPWLRTRRPERAWQPASLRPLLNGFQQQIMDPHLQPLGDRIVPELMFPARIEVDDCRVRLLQDGSALGARCIL